jgi:phage I-like protein
LANGTISEATAERLRAKIAAARERDNMGTEHVFLIDNFVTITAGDAIKLFPLKSIFKNGVERTAELIAQLQLPHFQPVIKRGSHADDAPALGHIVGLEVRDGFLWGLPEWNDAGLQSIQDGEFRYLSPEVIWEGEMENSATGELINGPLVTGAALLHMPALGDAAALYAVGSISQPDPEGENNMSEDTVSLTVLERVRDMFRAEQQPGEPTKPVEEPQADDYAAKIAAAEAEAEQYKAKVEAMEAEKVKAGRVSTFAADFAESPAVAQDAELQELLAGLDDDVAGALATKFKALSAQIDESKLTGNVGGNEPPTGGDPEKAMYAAAEQIANDRKVPLHEAFNILAAEQPDLLNAAGYGGA